MVAQPGAAVASAPPGSVSGGAPSAGGQSPSASDRELLSGAWQTVDNLRPYQTAWRVRECGRYAAWGYSDVRIAQGESGFSFGHIHRCGSPWACPACAHQIAMQRGAEVSQAVEWWRTKDDTGESDVMLVTLTLRHKAGDDLRTLRRGLSEAWRAVEMSRQWRDLRKDVGLSHVIRCQEVTWGDNGWHPHLHLLVFCTHPGNLPEWQQQATQLWRHHVRRILGDACLPNKRRALDIAPCEDRTYLTRMGLEVGSPAAKHARDGHLSAMQLAREIAMGGPDRERYGALWREYTLAMHGAHQLHWSHGLREALGEPVSDFEVVKREEFAKPVIAEIPAETWRDMARKRGLGPLDVMGKRLHGRPIQEVWGELLNFFRTLEWQSCRFDVHDGIMRLRWNTPY